MFHVLPCCCGTTIFFTHCRDVYVCVYPSAALADLFCIRVSLLEIVEKEKRLYFSSSQSNFLCPPSGKSCRVSQLVLALTLDWFSNRHVFHSIDRPHYLLLTTTTTATSIPLLFPLHNRVADFCTETTNYYSETRGPPTLCKRSISIQAACLLRAASTFQRISRAYNFMGL